ncbi:sulfotransferase 1C4-like [Branchiostoma floridae x Branchiostoma japonicum]
MPKVVTKETLDAMSNFQVRDDDVIVASYPKTGTNWLLEIILKIRRAARERQTELCEDSVMFGPMELKIPSMPQPGYIKLAEMPSPRIMNTHLPIQFVPPGVSKPQNKVKVLVPMRNPKDTAVSFFHFLNKMMPLENPGKEIVLQWEEFAQDFINAKVGYGDFCDHVLGWWKMRDDPHFLFLKYEDMKKDLLSAVKTIVAFLEVDLDESTIKGITEASTFNNMKADLDNAELVERQAIARKGIIGDWKNMFTPEQNEAFDAWYEKKLAGTGITFDFE